MKSIVIAASPDKIYDFLTVLKLHGKNASFFNLKTEYNKNLVRVCMRFIRIFRIVKHTRGDSN